MAQTQGRRVLRAQTNPVVREEEMLPPPRYQDQYRAGLREVAQPGASGPKQEMKRQKFQRVAEIRVNNVIKMMREIQKLGNPEVYYFTDMDRTNLVDCLRMEVEYIDEALQKKGKAASIFRFEDQA